MADFATRYRNARDAYRRARNGDATAEDEALIARLEADVAAARTPKGLSGGSYSIALPFVSRVFRRFPNGFEERLQVAGGAIWGSGGSYPA